MAMRLAAALKASSPVSVSSALPGWPVLSVGAEACWPTEARVLMSGFEAEVEEAVPCGAMEAWEGDLIGGTERSEVVPMVDGQKAGFPSQVEWRESAAPVDFLWQKAGREWAAEVVVLSPVSLRPRSSPVEWAALADPLVCSLMRPASAEEDQAVVLMASVAEATANHRPGLQADVWTWTPFAGGSWYPTRVDPIPSGSGWEQTAEVAEEGEDLH